MATPTGYDESCHLEMGVGGTVDEKTPLVPNNATSTKSTSLPSLPPYPHHNAPTKAAKNLKPKTKSKIISKAPRTRKNVRDFRKKLRDYSTWKGRIGVYVEVDSIDIKELHETVLKTEPWKIVEHYDVIHITLDDETFERDSALVEFLGGPITSEDEGEILKEATPTDIEALSPQIFIFSFGPVVFWNFPDARKETEWTRRNVLSYPDLTGENLEEPAMESANDEIAFMYGEGTKMRQDTVLLKTREAGEKLAVSFALAKSSLLSVYEWDLEQAIERNSGIPEELARTGKIHMTTPEISKEIGSIFLIKHSINLDSNLHDTPEEFWEDDRFEDVYTNVLNYFEIDKRLRLVNHRLDMIQDLHQVLREQEENHHAVYLEWIVIILIVVEVLFDFIEPLYYRRFFSDVDPFGV